jgi:hypothetical protein
VEWRADVRRRIRRAPILRLVHAKTVLIQAEPTGVLASVGTFCFIWKNVILLYYERTGIYQGDSTHQG